MPSSKNSTPSGALENTIAPEGAVTDPPGTYASDSTRIAFGAHGEAGRLAVPA